MQRQSATAPTLGAWLIFLSLGLTWGCSYFLIKRGLVGYPPVQVACIRVAVAGLAFLPIALRRARSLDGRTLGYLMVVGFVGTGFPALLFSIAQTEVDSSIAGIINSMTPLFTLLLGVLFFGQAFSRIKTAGILVGLSGVVLLILLGQRGGVSGNLWYGLLIVLATVGYAISTNTIKSHLHSVGPLTISAVSIGAAGVVAALWLLLGTDFVPRITANTDNLALPAFGYIVLLALVSTVLASVYYFKLIQMTSAVFASTLGYLIPVVALFIGYLDDEVITRYHFLSMLLILVGVWLAGRGR